jgi:hypothetical protein
VLQHSPRDKSLLLSFSSKGELRKAMITPLHPLFTSIRVLELFGIGIIPKMYSLRGYFGNQSGIDRKCHLYVSAVVSREFMPEGPHEQCSDLESLNRWSQKSDYYSEFHWIVLSGYFRAATPFILLDALAHRDRLQDSSPERAINCGILQPIGLPPILS